MQISIIIPAFNEEKRIEASLQEVTLFLPKHFLDWEVIVVDDGSMDRTAEIVRRFEHTSPNSRLTLEILPENMGKGAAVKHGVMQAKGKIILFMDADLSTPLTEIAKVVEALEQGADVAIGSRGQPDSNIVRHQPFYRETMGKIFNRIVRMLVIDGIRDTQCGFKAFRHQVAKEIFARVETTHFGFDVEVLLWARKLGFSVKEVGVTWINSPNSRVSPIKDSLKMLVGLFAIKRKVNARFKAEKKQKKQQIKALQSQ
ncbi:MAG: dolichyl-phosphate beta-glucosyltransferase [Chloroherpetonaceae bacterium]